MNVKLTLKLDKDVIDEAKVYSKRVNLSLSKIVERYLTTLTEGSGGQSGRDRSKNKLVDSLSGILKSEKINEKNDIADYLIEKYL